MKNMIATIKQAGATFKIPVQVKDDGEIFTADVMPVNQQEAEDFDDEAARWHYHHEQLQLLNDENNFPNSYK